MVYIWERVKEVSYLGWATHAEDSSVKQGFGNLGFPAEAVLRFTGSISEIQSFITATTAQDTSVNILGMPRQELTFLIPGIFERLGIIILASRDY
jgi:hypothetical protein